MENVTKKKKMPSYVKIFIGLFAGIVFGYILNFMGGTSVPMINDHILPFLQFLGDLFIKLIKMVVVPLVFFSIMNAAISLGDIKKLRSIGIKTIVWFLFTSALAVTIGLILANLIKPGKGVNFGSVSPEAVEAVKLPGIYQTLLDLIPNNPFQSLVNGDMMAVIVFALFVGFAIIMIGERAQPVIELISICAEAMLKIIGVIVAVIPIGVFGLMAVAITNFGTAIFGPVLKFIITDYLACLIMLLIVYSLLLKFVAKVSPFPFYKKAFEPWMIAFSTCASSAALPVSMEVAPTKLGVPRDISDFVVPFGNTANMDGTNIYFGIIVVFAAQLYGLELSIGQQIMLVLQATLLSVGCAATPQVGLVISITLLTQMGLPLEATALVAGVYRIIDQIHTSTNTAGDLVTSVGIAALEGRLDRDMYNDMSLK